MTTTQTQVGLAPSEGLLIDERPASPTQLEKYNRILQAAVDLADAGGYDAVQMRSVAEQSGIALATIYRYFISRDHLAYIVGDRWIAQAVAEAAPVPHAPVRSLAELRQQIFASAEAMGQHPQMLETYARAALTTDPNVVERIRERIKLTTPIPIPVPDGVDPTAWDTVTRAMSQVYFSGLVRWAYQQKKYEEIAQEVADIATLVAEALKLFAPIEAAEPAIAE